MQEKAVIAESEEMISVNCFAEYHHYDLSNQTCWAVVSVNASFYSTSKRAPVDIVAVIDRSGSMGGRKLYLVKKTLNSMIDQCEPNNSPCSSVYTPLQIIFSTCLLYCLLLP